MFCSPTFSFVFMQAGPLPHYLEQGQESQLHHIAGYPSLHSLLFLLQKKEKNNNKKSISGHLGENFIMRVEIEEAYSHEKSYFSTPTSKYPSISVSSLASRGCAAPHTTEGCIRLGTD